MHRQGFSTIKRNVLLFLTAAAAAVFQGVVANPASAHSLGVTATATCSQNAPVINYTVTSWDPGVVGSNAKITVSFNGVLVDTEAFTTATTPPNQFSGTKPAPTTGLVTVDVVAVDDWADAFPGGQTNSTSVTVPTDCAPPPPPSACTVTQGGWGAPAHGHNAGATLNAKFATTFPSGATIGGSPFKALFTSAQAVRNFLPQGGPPSMLNATSINPTSTSAGVFAGQVLALDLNVNILGVGSLTLSGTGTSLDGSTVSAVLAAANVALSGGALPSGFSFSSLNDLIDLLNSSFDGCVTSSWAATHLH